MLAGTMFKLNFHFKHLKAQSSFIHINWIILPMAAPWQGSKGTIDMSDFIRSGPNYWRRLVLVGPVRPSQNPRPIAEHYAFPGPWMGGSSCPLSLLLRNALLSPFDMRKLAHLMSLFPRLVHKKRVTFHSLSCYTLLYIAISFT